MPRSRNGSPRSPRSSYDRRCAIHASDLKSINWSNPGFLCETEIGTQAEQDICDALERKICGPWQKRSLRLGTMGGQKAADLKESYL